MQFDFFSSKNITKVVALSNKAFGKNYLPLSYYKKFINSDVNIGMVMVANKNIVGFITSTIYLVNRANTCEELYFNFNDLQHDIAIIKQVVVAPKYQKKGIGNLLLKQLISTINTKEIICIAWQRDKNIVIANLLLKNNFRKLKSIPNYWFNDSVSKQYNCPECKKPPCKCTGVVFKLLNN